MSPLIYRYMVYRISTFQPVHSCYPFSSFIYISIHVLSYHAIIKGLYHTDFCISTKTGRKLSASGLQHSGIHYRVVLSVKNLLHDPYTDCNDDQGDENTGQPLCHNLQCNHKILHHIAFPPFSFYKYEATMLITRPPATTDAICPDTFAPAACIIMIFPGDSSCAIF